MYSGDDLNILNFFRMFYLLIQKYKISNQKIEADDFSECELQLKISTEDLKQLLHHYQAAIESVNDFLNNSLERYSVKSDIQEVFPNMMDLKEALFMPSPKINIDDYENLPPENQNTLNLTPVESESNNFAIVFLKIQTGIFTDSHKELFSRHALLKKNTLLSRKPLPVQRINFDDSISSLGSNKSTLPTFDQSFVSTTSTAGKCSLKKADKYARVFSRRVPNIDKGKSYSKLLGQFI